MTENTPEDVLDFYGKEIPVGIAKSAYHHNIDNTRNDYPRRVVKLREAGDVEIGDETLVFREVHRLEGILVERVDDDEYWALADDVVSTCVARLVKTTDLVVVEGEEEYLPPLVTNEDDDDGLLVESKAFGEEKLELQLHNEIAGEVSGVGPRKAYLLDMAGFTTIEDLREADQRELADVDGIGNALAARIKADVGDTGEDDSGVVNPWEAWATADEEVENDGDDDSQYVNENVDSEAKGVEDWDTVKYSL